MKASENTRYWLKPYEIFFCLGFPAKNINPKLEQTGVIVRAGHYHSWSCIVRGTMFAPTKERVLLEGSPLHPLQRVHEINSVFLFFYHYSVYDQCIISSQVQWCTQFSTANTLKCMFYEMNWCYSSITRGTWDTHQLIVMSFEHQNTSMWVFYFILTQCFQILQFIQCFFIP